VVDYPAETEKTVKKEVMSFRGDDVNGFEVTDRRPDQERLRSYVPSRSAHRGFLSTVTSSQALLPSAATLNYVRAVLSSGPADTNTPHQSSSSRPLTSAPGFPIAVAEVMDSLMDGLETMRVAAGGAGEATA
jgi:3-deoxy-7-phosphoheptulonate synthase